VNTAVTILEIAPLDAALAVSGAMSITVSAISLVAVHLGTDDRTDGEAANDAGGDLAVFGQRGFRRDNDSESQTGSDGGGSNFQHGLGPFDILMEKDWVEDLDDLIRGRASRQGLRLEAEYPRLFISSG
jgi:hypothetical protein